MPKYTATFSDGTVITRKSERAYAAAWRATWTDGGRLCQRTGFAVNADKAAPFAPSRVFVTKWMGSNARAEAQRRNAEFRAACGYRVEIVATVAA